MSLPSPTSNKRRPPLATLPNASSGAHRRSSLAQPAGADIPLHETMESPAMKKPRRSASKRVSFGGEHIKVFRHDHDADWDESPPLQPPPVAAALQPSPVRPRAGQSPRSSAPLSSPSPPPRRSPRFVRSPRPSLGSRPDTNDDGDTLTLPHPADMIQDQASTPDRLSSSPLFMDEDVTSGVEALRLSTAGGCGDDTTVILSIPAPATSISAAGQDAGQDCRRESMQSNLSDGDITQQIPGMNGLLDIDEADDGGSRGPVGIAGGKGGEHGAGSTFASLDGVATATGDGDVTVGDVTSQALPLASLLADDDCAERSPNVPDAARDGIDRDENDPSPTCSSGRTTGRTSIGDITMGVPSMGALLSMDEPAVSGTKTAPPSPRLPGAKPASARPALPESRQLFSREHFGEDDPTIHYHDAVGTGADGEAGASVAMGAMSAAPAAALDDSSAEHGGRAGATRVGEQPSRAVHDDSTAPAATHALAAAENGGNLLVSEFLDAVNIQFRDDDFKCIQRGASLGRGLVPDDSDGEGDESSAEAQRAAKFKRVHSAVQAQATLKVLETSVQQMREEIGRRQERIAELTQTIERSTPRCFARLADASKLKPSELSKMQLEFKRLRKASAMQAKGEHARVRCERERSIAAAESGQVLFLEADKGMLAKTADLLVAEGEALKTAIAAAGLDPFVEQAAGSEIDPTVTATLRSEVASHAAALAAAEERIATALSDKSSMAEENAALEAGNCELAAEVRRVRRYAQASSRADLVKLAGQRRDEHLILSAVTGVQPLSLSDAEVHVRLLGTLDVRFGLQGSAVTTVNCSATADNGRVDAATPFGKFVLQAVSLVSERCLKRVGVVNEIPPVLQRAVSFLMHALKADHSLALYAAEHEASYRPAGLPSSCSPAAELAVKAEYYSVARHCKFDVTLSLLAVAPAWRLANAADSGLHARVDSIDAVIGDCPSKDSVREAVAKATSGGAQYPLADALQSIWKLLQ